MIYLGFTQTQERSYPTGADSPDPDEDVGPESPAQEMSEEEEKPTTSSQRKHRVQIMNDSDNEEVEAPVQNKARSSGNRDFLKKFMYDLYLVVVMKIDNFVLTVE